MERGDAAHIVAAPTATTRTNTQAESKLRFDERRLAAAATERAASAPPKRRYQRTSRSNQYTTTSLCQQGRGASEGERLPVTNVHRPKVMKRQ